MNLSDGQQAIEAAGLLHAPASALLNVPTGFGKTFLARRAIRNALDAGFRAVYLCPLRALARELRAEWQREFDGLGVYTGETGVDEAIDIPAPADAQVMIATPEKFDAYLRGWQGNLQWLARIDLLVVDEAHMLADAQRGATLEGVIARLRIINPFVRVLMLSATLGNPDELARWIDGGLFQSSDRPVPLAWRIATFDAKREGAKGKADIAIREAQDTARDKGQSIVFCQSRPRTESLAEAMREQGLRAAAHHAGLSPSRRQEVERQFREGALDVVVATPTLAMGINMPCRKVIVHDLQRFSDGGWADLSVTEIWQLGGRAGRRGFDTAGEVILISAKHDQTAARRFIAGRFEPVRSALTHHRKLAEQVLVLVGSRLCKTATQATRLMGGFLYGVQHGPVLAAQVAHAIARMTQAGMLEEEEGSLRATRLGRLAVRHQLSAETVIAWREFAAHCESLGREPTFMDVLTVVAGSGDFNARLRVDAQDLSAITQAFNTEPMLLKSVPAAAWSPAYVSVSGKVVVGAIRTALALRAWTRLGDMEAAAELIGVQAHEIEESRKEMCRMLVGFRALLLVMRGDEDEGEDRLLTEHVDVAERVLALAAMVATGMNEQNASLALIEGIGPVIARKLLAAGIEDIEDLAQAEPDDLVAMGGISTPRAARWIAAADELIAHGGAYRYREMATSREVVFAASDNLDYYRWMRAADLEVSWIDADHATVTGGSAPHQIARHTEGWQCDCADAAKGRLCKHVIAVRHVAGDSTIPRFGGPFQSEDDEQTLWALWNQSGRTSWK